MSFLIRAGLTAGCIYYSVYEGVWTEGARSEEIKNTIADKCSFLDKYMKKDILEIRDIASPSQFWNYGVENVFIVLSNSPAFISLKWWRMLQANGLVNSVSGFLPDDRPITSLAVVENPDSCPKGFHAIRKTYDEDSDADLWRDSSFLKKKTGRYLCISKSEGQSGFVIDSINVIREKENITEGLSVLIIHTSDTGQRAWRKRQICYRLKKREDATQAITDIIICSRAKKPPEGFCLAGEINGVIVCFKMGNAQDTEANKNSGAKPTGPTRPIRPPPPPPAYSSANYPNLDGDYEIINPGYTPSRPAPQPPTPISPITTGTLPLHHGLEDVPFIMNTSLITSGIPTVRIPLVRNWTLQSIEKEFSYEFKAERQMLSN